MLGAKSSSNPCLFLLMTDVTFGLSGFHLRAGNVEKLLGKLPHVEHEVGSGDEGSAMRESALVHVWTAPHMEEQVLTKGDEFSSLRLPLPLHRLVFQKIIIDDFLLKGILVIIHSCLILIKVGIM